MYDQAHYRYDVFISYPWSHPEGRWVTKVFQPTLQGTLRNTFPDWEPRFFFGKNAVAVGSDLEREIQEALRRSCVLVPVLCYPYFRSPWCAAEWRSFRTPMMDGNGTYGRKRRMAPTIYAGDIDRYPKRARRAGGLTFHQLSDFNVLQQSTQKFRREIQILADAIVALMQGESEPPDPRWPAFTGNGMDELKQADPQGTISEWMLVPPPEIHKPTYGPPERVA